MTEPFWVGNREIEDSQVLVLDGYVDEPSLLGVPPYISPEPRMLAGVLEEFGVDWEYLTVDEYREFGLPDVEKVIVHGGVTVPGKYLGGKPLLEKEAEEIAVKSDESFLGGPLARYGDVVGFDHQCKKDLSAYVHDLLNGGGRDRWGELDERERWLKKGAVVVKRHPLYPDPLLAEMSMYRGCPRYFTGGCSFCSEPAYGRPEFREKEDIVEEFGRLYDLGLRHFRMGGQSCTFSYKAEDIGDKEVPRPRAQEIEGLFSSVWERCPAIEVLHVDNGNPAVLAEYPEESEEILGTLVEYTTAGNVIALGMESADMEVVEKNNLNSTPEQVVEAVELINDAGRGRGENGMPKLLPGINFLGGLKGESEETYDKNYEFLEELKDEGHWLRRINIRQVLSSSDEFEVVSKDRFNEFKKKVRENIDRPLLREMFPGGTVLKDVYMEKREGKITFGRQIGSYPLLVGVEYPLELGEYIDVKVTDYGYRSITGIEHPFYVNEASFKELQAVPGIGQKRAGRIFTEQPGDEEELREIVEDRGSFELIMNYVDFK